MQERTLLILIFGLPKSLTESTVAQRVLETFIYER